MKKDFIIYTKMLEIVLWLFEKVNTFPKKQRFVLGQQIENSAPSNTNTNIGFRVSLDSNCGPISISLANRSVPLISDQVTGLCQL